MRKNLWLDCETTGIKPEKNGIISLAMIYELNGVVQDELYVEMNPRGKELDPKALGINKYTEEMISKFRPWEQVKVDVDIFLQNYVNKWDKTDKFILCGQNPNFDLQFLINYYETCNDNYIGSYIKLGGYIDTLPFLTILQDMGKVPVLENSKLETICDHFEVELGDAHNALADIRATMEVYGKMKELIK